MTSYDKQTWANGVAGGTRLNAANLQHMEDGIESRMDPDTLDSATAALVDEPTSDLVAALAYYLDRAHHTGTQASTTITGLATVGRTGAYGDLTGRPSLATVATTGVYSDLSGKPSLATVATTGAYNDLTGKPTAYDDEMARDAIGNALTGTGIVSISVDDVGDEINIDATVALADLPPGSVFFINKAQNGGAWPADRGTARADLMGFWVGADPDPATVGSGSAGFRTGIDVRVVTP